MVCDHTANTTQFCPDCGVKLQDDIVDKFNKELIPKIEIFFYNLNGNRDRVRSEIYEFMIENQLKAPEKMFFDIKPYRFAKHDCIDGESKLYIDKLSKNMKSSSLTPLWGIKWLFPISESTLANISCMKDLEYKYDIPLPDNSYSSAFATKIESLHAMFNWTEYKDNRQVIKEYLKSIIDKM